MMNALGRRRDFYPWYLEVFLAPILMMSRRVPGMVRSADQLGAMARQIGWHDYGTTKKKERVRKAPAEHACEFPEGTVRQGLDGEMWTIGVTRNGVQRWVRLYPT